MATFLVPFLWITTDALAFADFPLRPAPYAAGVLALAFGLWLFHRSHADLGTQWSITLELRAGHRLVTEGVYRRIRHPIYAALLLYGVGQALVLPNWVAGPCYLVAMLVLCALRLGPEERMMREEFGSEYEAYAARTERLVPGVW
jgi:protein-S-isoprenylcysteine O-methyltransferase Ste14